MLNIYRDVWFSIDHSTPLNLCIDPSQTAWSGWGPSSDKWKVPLYFNSIQYSSDINVSVNMFQTRSIEIRKRVSKPRFLKNWLVCMSLHIVPGVLLSVAASTKGNKQCLQDSVKFDKCRQTGFRIYTVIMVWFKTFHGDRITNNIQYASTTFSLQEP